MADFQPPRLTLTTDIAIFAIRDDRLELLLIRRKNPPYQGHWALPGGLVEEDEDVDLSARRELREETGVEGLALEQVHVFGAPGRDPRGRYVTVAYLTLVRPEKISAEAGSDAEGVGWFPVDGLPEMAFDHAEIIRTARKRLGERLRESASAFGYLPEAFAIEDWRRLHEIVAGHPIDPERFRGWALASGLVEHGGKYRPGDPGPFGRS